MSSDKTEAQRLEIAERLRRGREYVGLSQEDVANALKIPRPAISNIESGTRRVEAVELDRMAQLYGLSINYLLTGEEGFGTSAPSEQVAFLARALKDLSPDDLGEVARFAAFLKRSSSANSPKAAGKRAKK